MGKKQAKVSIFLYTTGTDWNEHIEIKGYKTELDECKWRQFPVEEKLSVWHKKDLKRINIIK